MTERLKLETGYDSLFIPGSAKDVSRSWLSQCNEHYHVKLKAQSVLVFSNAACLHHFRNCEVEGGIAPEALSTRLKYDAGMDRRAFWHELADPALWWRSSLTVSAFLFLGTARENRPAKVVQEGKTE